MSFTPQSVFAMLTSRAESVTLRRLGGVTPVDVTVLAKIDDADDNPLVGNMAQFRRRVVISDLEIAEAGWPGPPKRNDQIIASSKTLTVMSCDPIVIGAQTVMHRMMTLGA